MSALEIKPHSRRLSGWAVGALSLLAAGSFTAGLARQIGAANAPSPFPTGQEASPQVATASAPTMQLAAGTPAPRHAVAEAPPALDVPPQTAPAAEPVPTTDASATAPDQAAPAPAPLPPEDPPTP